MIIYIITLAPLNGIQYKLGHAKEIRVLLPKKLGRRGGVSGKVSAQLNP